MRTSHCLGQTVLKLQGQPFSIGISKIRPFFNLPRVKEDTKHTSKFQFHQKRNMASATTFFDFNTKDSERPRSFTSPPFVFRVQRLFTDTNFSPSRSRQTLPTIPTPRQSRPRRQHRFQMWLHTPTRGPGKALQIHLH